MLSDELHREGVELGLMPILGLGLTREIADVQKGGNQKVEGPERSFLDGEPPIAIRSVSALDLDANLARDLVGIGMNANEIVPLVVRGCLVG